MKYILCYGDSNTWGHNPEGGRYNEEERWTALLQKQLSGKAVVYEEGLCGRTIMYDDPTAPDRNGLRFLNCAVQSHQPLDLIILMLGTNDVRHIFSPCVKEIAMGMENMVKLLLNPSEYWVGNIPQILVVAPAAIRDEIKESNFYGIYDEESVKKSRQLYEAYSTILKGKAGVHLINANDIAEVSVLDCIHFTRKGHYDFACALEITVKKILGI